MAKPVKSFSILIIFLILLVSNSVSDPSDESCLSSLYSSLIDPSHNLHNWTKPNFKNPCNGFTSFIYGATCNNNRIYKLSLTSLSISGYISPLITNCTNLQTLDLSSNSLAGEIPNLSSLINLAVLNLSRNQLSGQIPLQLASCVYLNVIDLHNNLLTGSIPDNLGMLVRLSVFDVSNNRLTGWIPVSLVNRSGGSGVRFNASSFVGNDGLVGYPLRMGKGKGLSVLAIVGIGLGSGFLSLVISFTVVCIWLRVTERRDSFNADADADGKVNHHHMPDY